MSKYYKIKKKDYKKNDSRNKTKFRKIIPRNYFIKNNLKKGTLVYIIERIKAKRTNTDLTGVRDVHEFVKKRYFKNEKDGRNLYIELKDKYKALWRLEYVYTKKRNKEGKLCENGFFVWFNPKTPPDNWDTEYILKTKKEDLPMAKEETTIPKVSKNKETFVNNNLLKKKYTTKKEDKKTIQNIGRWQKKEIEMFNSQFTKFNRKWDKYNISYNGKIRISSQIRSFAQKYFKKKNKSKKLTCYNTIDGAKYLFFFITDLYK